MQAPLPDDGAEVERHGQQDLQRDQRLDQHEAQDDVGGKRARHHVVQDDGRGVHGEDHQQHRHHGQERLIDLAGDVPGSDQRRLKRTWSGVRDTVCYRPVAVKGPLP